MPETGICFQRPVTIRRNRLRWPLPQTNVNLGNDGPWWIPFGYVVRRSDASFRWCLLEECPDTGEKRLASGRLGISQGVGILLDSEVELYPVDPGFSYDEIGDCIDFPFAHLFFDPAGSIGNAPMGVWYCLHGHMKARRDEVETLCSPGRLHRLICGFDRIESIWCAVESEDSYWRLGP